ncbi:MAG: heme ABC exporter ATP-binding protein CcmA [Bacteroidetes bacterium]|nr:heme ABC exporter ATP-binding protein CcmA [Bacteroidota bacterium]
MTAPAEAFIDLRDVCRQYGRFRALDRFSCTFAKTDFTAVLGRNGAGKSTLLRILSTVLKPTDGQILVDGINIHRSPAEVLRHIGVVAHHTFLYGDLTAYENLEFYGNLYQVPQLEQRINNLLDQVGLTGWSNELARKFSRGMQQRLAIARALVHDPAVLLLDEPYTGLDQKASSDLDAILNAFHAQGRCIIVVSHDVERITGLARRTLLVDHGKLVADTNQGIDTREIVNTYKSLLK